MPHSVSPTRRVEAKRLITHLFAHEPFDADRFIDQLGEVMLETPALVKTAARQLKEWNQQDKPNATAAFSLEANDFDYEVMAEVVLDAAAVFRGDTQESPIGQPLPDPSYRAMVTVLNSASEFLRGVAVGRTNRQSAEGLASQLSMISQALAERFNVRNTSNTESDH